MKVMAVVALTLLIVGIYGFYSVSSQTKEDIKEGFTNVKLQNPILSFCPQFAPQIQTAKGNTDCCQGEIVDGKCNGKTFCTLSPSHDGIPTCDNAWRSYFLERAKKNCPSSMIYYFEDVKNVRGAKGCSTSQTNKQGNAPSNTGARRCVIYPTDRENREKADSCYIERERLKTRCPVFRGVRPNAQTIQNRNVFSYYQCSYNISGQLPLSCFEDRTSKEFLTRTNPNWSTQSNVQATQDNFCSNFVAAQRRKEDEAKRVAEQKKKISMLERSLNERKAALAKSEQQRKDALAKAKRDSDAYLKRIRELQAKCKK